VYNDSGGNFRQFMQHDRDWRLLKPDVDGLIVNETSSSPVLVDLRSWVPARELLSPILQCTGTGAATSSMQIANITSPDHISSSTPGKWLVILYSPATTEDRYSSAQSLPAPYSAIFIDGTAGADLYQAGFIW
jgi:hypothetical protein